MKIETKYSCGDTVYKIANKRNKEWVVCGFCDGVGRISGSNDTTRSCPECYGRKGRYEYLPTSWQIDTTLTIGQVRVEITDSPGMPNEDLFDNYKAQQGHKEEYMCIETGVGSGTIHRVDLLWPDKESAQAECDRLNAETEKEAA